MIVLKAESEVKTISPINVSTPSEKSTKKPSESFGELLRGVKTRVDKPSDTKQDAKVVQNGTVVLAFDNKEITLPVDSRVSKDTKEVNSESLASLLKGDAAILGEEIKALQLNPEITKNLNIKELKTLIGEAKQYLKEQILKSDGYKQSQIKDLPQTLKGLAQLAKKFDINISKITFENVQVKTSDTKLEIKEEAKVLKKDIKVSDTDELTDLKTQLKTDKKIPKVVQNNTNIDTEIQKDIKQDTTRTKRVDALKVESTSKLAQTPIFKAQSNSELTTTEQVVMAKQFKAPEVKTQKDKADETLKLLLRGEKPSHANANLTADFSVATAKVIAPSATTEVSKSLESLLRGDAQPSAGESKVELSNVPKADSFEVKLNEAKQMIKYISQDVKTAIEDYKSPFTRIKVQLNPQKLGDVELTVIQRGKNLHVNISSNNVAVGALASNLNELKTQLNNSGINNATFNFNSSSQNGSSSNEQQQNRQQEQQNANEEYNYFDLESQNEEILNSLEIVVPSYA